MYTVTRLQRLALPAVVLAGTCSTQAIPVASVMLRQYATASGVETYQSFNAIDCQGSYAAAQAAISGNADFDTLIWYWNGVSGAIKYREGTGTITGHNIVGNNFTVRAGQLQPTVAVNRSGQVGYLTALRITCADPLTDPACDYNGVPALIRDSQYGIGGADPAFICGLSGYPLIVDSALDSVGRVYGRLTNGGLTPQDNLGRGIAGATETLICDGNPIANTVGGTWGRLKSTTSMDIVSLTGWWYGIDQLRQLPTDQNLAAVVNGASRLREKDLVYFWGQPGQTARLSDIDDIALSIHDDLLWTGQLTLGGDITSNNNDVVGYGPYVILREGASVTGIPNALSAYFGRTSGGGAARYLATDDNCNVAWVITCAATYAGPNWPQDPNDTYVEDVDALMYNGQVILAAGSLIDQNADGVINGNDFGATFLNVSRNLALDGQNAAWFVGNGHLSVGERECVFRLNNLPTTSNPWCNPPDPNPCHADLNGDGKVNQSDLGLLLAAYELHDGGDCDGDGDTDQSDLGILLAEYGICGY